MRMWRKQLDEILGRVSADVTRLVTKKEVLICDADVPPDTGVYMFLCDGEIKYIGEAKGSGGLRDRVLSKHVSGDDSHALQRALHGRFPNRLERREHIKNKVYVKWVAIDSPSRIAVVERVAISLFCPPWNLI